MLLLECVTLTALTVTGVISISLPPTRRGGGVLDRPFLGGLSSRFGKSEFTVVSREVQYEATTRSTRRRSTTTPAPSEKTLIPHANASAHMPLGYSFKDVTSVARFFILADDHRICNQAILPVVLENLEEMDDVESMMKDVTDLREFCKKHMLRRAVFAVVGGSQRNTNKGNLSGVAVSSEFPNSKDIKKIERLLKNSAKSACKPRKVVVPVPPNDNKYIRYEPSCTIIERCGGCCDSEVTHCVPVPDGVKMAKRQVVKMQLPKPDGTPSSILGIQTVRVEKHTKCRCECKIQKSNCTQMQRYVPNDCRCECRNLSEQTNCTFPRVWDNNSCTCKCPKIMDCTTGLQFDPKLCVCVNRDDVSSRGVS